MIDVDMFSKHLYTRYYPDPDLLIRTSGEMRLSNFLLWQLSYTEMYVTSKLWPDFTRKDLFDAVQDFGNRNRRYGAVE
jgi:undecaprenyl diphosphate synthase